MTGPEFREARQQLEWTQKEAAAKLGLSQPYLSLLENGVRPVTPELVSRVSRHTTLPATGLPLESPASFDPQVFAASLGALGYPRFSHLANSGRRDNPAALLLTALRQDQLEPRLTEALPWLVLHYSKLNWDWLVEHAKRQNLQNRVGFVVSLARELAEKQGASEVVQTLAHWERELEDARLAKVDALARRLTAAERKYFQDHRSAAATHWNLLTGLTADALDYAS